MPLPDASWKAPTRSIDARPGRHPGWRSRLPRKEVCTVGCIQCEGAASLRRGRESRDVSESLCRAAYWPGRSLRCSCLAIAAGQSGDPGAINPGTEIVEDTAQVADRIGPALKGAVALTRVFGGCLRPVFIFAVRSWCAARSDGIGFST